MYTPEEMDGTPVLVTLRLAKKHESTWQDKPDWYWLWRLFQEFIELFGSLLGIHKDPVKWELMQISAICLNWMKKNDKHFKHLS